MQKTTAQAANAPPNDTKQATTTEYKIGKVTYLVTSSASEKATDTIGGKVEKLILKDMRKMAGNSRFPGKNC